MKITTSSVDETIQAGVDFAGKLQANSPILLYGEMGAGKTHFVKGLARGLGIADNITSPTFALVNQYSRLTHFDLFRVNTMDDLYAIGFYDYMGEGVLAIEWAENVPGLKDELDGYYTVTIEKIGENERVITIDNIGT